MAALQTRSPRTFGYEMPDAITGCLVNGSTWDLWCRDCDRHVYVNVVDMIERHGERFTTDILWHRSRCRDCDERLNMAGGAFVKRLKEYGHFHRLVVADGSDFHRPLWPREHSHG